MGGKTTTSTNQVTIPQDVLDRYNAVNAQAAKAAENPFQKYGTTQEDFVAQFNEQQNKGVEGINAVAGMGPVYENVDKYLNPYIKNVADTTRAQIEQANEQAQSGALGTAIQSNAFGGDRAGVAAANLAGQQNLALGSTMANIYNQGYTQAVDTSMNDRNRMLGVAGAQLGAGTQMQQTEQAGLDALINQFQQEQGYPFQVAQFLANIAMGTGALSGSTTTTTQPAQVFSDRRLKHDIKKIGEADNGLPIYTFKYKGDEHHQTHVGFMADEVEKKNPDAVGLDPSGYKTVDYDKAAQSMGGAVKSFADGGVAGPYGSKVGQGVGVGSYVPQAYLPVGELMMADPAAATAHQSGILDALESAASMGKSVVEIRNLLNNPSTKTASENARGGVVGYAGGGGVEPKLHGDYLSSTLAAQEAGKDKPELKVAGQQGQQGSALGNIASTIGSVATIAQALPMIFSSDRRLKHDIKRIGKTEKGLPIYTFKYKGDNREQTHIGFMADEVERDHPEAVGKRDGYKTVDYSQAHKFADGGVAGRHGYALDGTVNGDAMRLTRDEVPAAQTLGSLPSARVVAAEAAPSAEEESARAYRAAAANRFNGLAPAADQVRPMARPTGLVPAADTAAPTVEQRPMARPTGLVPVDAPTVEQRPMARPTGLVPAAPADLAPTADQVRPLPRPTGLVPVATPMEEQRPPARPEGLGAVAAGYDDAKDYFRTRILAQESGNRQFDENGQPLTSPKGATGIAQVMKATGPEAAALANLPWDERLWERDADYNAAIGEAYFLDQYRKFGSIDKASAAYNAGPGALQEAMAKAESLGGSYLDYLPAETQNYVKSTTGISGGAGVSGVGGGAGGDRLETPEGGVKPYDERNTLGKMMYDEDGKVNKNALLSLLAGFGDMVSSPSPFLLPAIGAGVAGAARTYMAREEQLGDITKKNVENMGSLYDLYNKFMFDHPELTGMTLEEFAERNGLTHMLPEPTGTGTGTATETGLKPLTLQDTRRSVDAGNGITIPFMNDYASLVRAYAEWQNAPEGTRQRLFADNAKAKIDQIRLNGYTTGFNEDGEAVVVPVDPVRAEIGAAVTDQNNIENTTAFREKANEVLPTIDPAINAINDQAKIYSGFEANALATASANAGALASALGITIEGLNDADQVSAVQKALKDRARSIVERGGTGQATDFLTNFIAEGSAGPNLDPDAVKKLLVLDKASLMREKERLGDGHKEWQRQAPNPYDLNEYQSWFAENKPLESFIKDAEKDMPMFAGETGSFERPYQLSESFTMRDVPSGRYFIAPDGTIRGPMP
jgi:soluble lytic murein transglycosylase-like protein